VKGGGEIPLPDARTPPPGRGSRPTRLWDVVVIGNDLPGLVAAALLAKRGLRILHVDHGAPHDRHTSGGFRLQSLPMPSPLPRASRSLHAVAEELGVLPMIGRSMAPFPGGLQILLPSARIALPPSADARAAELARAFGAAGPGLAREVERLRALADRAAGLFEDAPPLPASGLLERWKASRFIGRATGELGPVAGGSPLLLAIASLHRLSSRLEGGPSALDFSRATAPWLFEPARPPDGGFVSMLRASIRGHRGDTLGEPDAPERIEEVSIERGRFAGIRLEGQGAIHRGRIGLVACPLGAIAPLIAAPRLRAALERFDERLPAERHVATWNFVLSEEAIPPGLGELAAVAGDDGEVTLLEREPARDEDGRIASGLVAVKASRIAADEVEAKRRVDAALEEAMPFHERHLRHQARAPSRQAVHRAPDGRAPATLPIRSPVSRLLVGNAAILPGFGLEGTFLAGGRIAALAAEAVARVKL